VKLRTLAAIAAIGALGIVFALIFSKNVDFVVYWYGARDFLHGDRPAYGPLSGVGYPQEYRYPPITMLFFLPMTLLPLKVAGIIWVVLAWVACAWASWMAMVKWRLRFNATGVVLGLLVLWQFIVLFVKFGNVQPYLIAFVLLALLWSEEHPAWSGLILALAACFKVWPLFFLPWLLLRKRRRAVYYAAAASAVLWVAPVFFFGRARYVALMKDFYTHAVTLAGNPEAVWYSSQSLRGILLRFLTHAAAPRDGYPDVSFAGLSPALVGGFCVVVTIVLYGYAVLSTWRAPESKRFLWDANAFVFFSILEPFAMNSGLISLLPGVLAAVHIYSAPPDKYPKAAKLAFLIACSFAAIASCTFYRPLQRVSLMLGIDFWMMLALGASLAIAATGRKSEKLRRPLVETLDSADLSACPVTE